MNTGEPDSVCYMYMLNDMLVSLICILIHVNQR